MMQFLWHDIRTGAPQWTPTAAAIRGGRIAEAGREGGTHGGGRYRPEATAGGTVKSQKVVSSTAMRAHENNQRMPKAFNHNSGIC